jgi:ATP-dependent Clp protease ATP-binding subunit ClpA
MQRSQRARGRAGARGAPALRRHTSRCLPHAQTTLTQRLPYLPRTRTPQVAEAVSEAGLAKPRLEAALAAIRGAGGANGGNGAGAGAQRHANSASAEGAFAALDAYGIDLTARASKLDPVIGRDEEIRRVIRVLCRRVCERVRVRGARRKALPESASPRVGTYR